MRRGWRSSTNRSPATSFRDENPTGRRFGFRAFNDPGAIEIVGVVKDALYADMRQGTTEENNETPRFVYTPFQQSDELNEMTVYVRTAGPAAAGMPEQLRQAVRRADTAMPVFEMQSMAQTVDEALFNERMLALLSGSFGLLATLLAAIGLYGVMSYTVSRRTREIGIRIALGAERTAVVWLVLREVALLTIVGIARRRARCARPEPVRALAAVRDRAKRSADHRHCRVHPRPGRPARRLCPAPGARRACSRCWPSATNSARPKPQAAVRTPAAAGGMVPRPLGHNGACVSGSRSCPC